MAENDLIPKKCGADKQIVSREDSLLDIFTDENLLCHNLREMNTALTQCFNALQTEVKSDAHILPQVTPELLKTIGLFLRGEELRNAEGTLVADLDALSKEILQKIKQGVYKIAESKQIDGNLRAAVVDKKGKIIKQITLKHAAGNKIVAGDLNTLAVQATLRQITRQLECIDAGVQYLITLKRRSDFQTPYFDAVRKIIEAQNTTNVTERKERIQKAIDDLNHGLNGLYGDLGDCIKTLKGRWIPIASKRNLDYIAEDMVYIPQYVALLSYLYNYQGKQNLAWETVRHYRDKINQFVSEQITEGYTAAQLVHSRYSYIERNRDFWIDGMGRIQSEMATLKLLPTSERAEEKPVYYLTFVDVQEESSGV